MTSDMQLTLETADHLQARARRIIETTRIQDLWETIGQTVLVGSARFGLMTTPNIDFEVYVQKPSPRDGFSVILEIASLPGVVQIQYLNLLDSDDPGLYWRIDYRDQEGVLWDFDNWLVSFSHPHAGMADAFAQAMARTLTPATRVTILRLKSSFARFGPKEKPRGIDIYKAVLRDCVQGEQDFRDWQSKNPPVLMETWRP